MAEEKKQQNQDELSVVVILLKIGNEDELSESMKTYVKYSTQCGHKLFPDKNAYDLKLNEVENKMNELKQSLENLDIDGILVVYQPSTDKNVWYKSVQKQTIKTIQAILNFDNVEIISHLGGVRGDGLNDIEKYKKWIQAVYS
eukprot:451167_1